MREIVGRSPAMLDVYKLVARVAASMSTVLVVGESGTGKSSWPAPSTATRRAAGAVRRGQLHRA